MRKQITDRPTYLRAHKNFEDLQNLLGNLQGKLSEVSKDVDKEFLASYRVHMLSIQSEIKTLREDVDKGVQALKSDGNVAKLELEVNWFVEECTRLRLHYTTMENDFVQMQSRFKAMMEQKVYMNEQLKAILKRNRVLEAEIEHALKHNQKIKKTEEEYEAAWEAANLIDNQANGVTGAGPQAAEADTEQAELPPDNYYHEQLRRLSAKSPLSTTKFVPPAGNRSAKGSKGGSRAGSRGGSRDSSRDRGSPSRSRAASPGSPSPLRPGALSGVLRNAEGLSGKGEIEGGGEEGLGDGEEELDEFQRSEPLGFLPVQSQAAAGPAAVSSSSAFAFPSSSRQLQPSSSLPMIRQQPQQQQQQQSLKMVSTQQSTKSTQQRIPKQETVPTETARWREKRKIKQQRRDQEELNNFLKHKSPAEAALERAIADIFEEVRTRKINAAKRGAIKRFPVHFMGGSVHDNSAAEDANYGNGDSGGNMARQRSGRTGAVAGASSGPARGLQHQHQKQQQVLPGTALGRRLAGEVSDAGSFDDEICDGEERVGTGPQQQQQRLLAPGLGEEEADLLRQPLIRATGGISGLGASQLSDNDKFSCVVKYLLDFDRFKELVEKLQQFQ